MGCKDPDPKRRKPKFKKKYDLKGDKKLVGEKDKTAPEGNKYCLIFEFERLK